MRAFSFTPSEAELPSGPQNQGVPTVADYLRGRPGDGASWRFEWERHLHGAFGGAFGGVVAAGVLIAARAVAGPGRVPASLDLRFVRGVPAGPATVTPTVLHAGRSMSTIRADVHDGDGRLCTTALVSLVAPGELATETAVDAGAWSEAPPSGSWETAEPREVWGSRVAPIVETFRPRLVGSDHRGIGTALRVPWDDPAAAHETACCAADICLGPPVGSSVGMAPNPDLSLRFVGAVDGREPIGYGRVERVRDGVAVVSVSVWSAAGLAAIGVASALVLPRPPGGSRVE